MEELLKSNFFLLDVIVLLSVAIMGNKLDERRRCMLIYSFCLCLAIVDTRFRYVVLSSTLVLLVMLEYLSPDEMRVKLFTSLGYKLRDFCYRLFVELGYGYFVLSIASVRLLPHYIHFGYAKAFGVTVGALLVIRALHVLASPSFKSRDITEVIKTMNKHDAISSMEDSQHVQRLLAMLVAFEDHGYFGRKPSAHTVISNGLYSKVKAYLSTYGWAKALRAIKNVFNRGYSTLEMQLIRSIGLEIGATDRWRDIIRRKIYELCYTGMIINSYAKYLERGGGGYTHYQYREYIARQYIHNVDVRINGKTYRAVNEERSTLLQLFNAEDISSISDEQFFVWCLGLPYYAAIGPIAVGLHANVLHTFSLQRGRVLQIIATL